jgi:glycerophosphoryl diester phosphodiesterase
VYTVNDEEIMKMMTSKGVTGIFHDKLDVIKQIVENL